MVRSIFISRIVCFTIITGIIFSIKLFPQEIIIHKRDAVVWGQTQSIKGGLLDFYNNEGTLYLNGNEINFDVSPIDSSFDISINLGEGENHISLKIPDKNSEVLSDTLKLTLGYRLTPEVYAYATVNNNNINLHAQVIENPDSSSLDFVWTADPSNPTLTSISNPEDTTTSVTISSDSPDGEYYFDLNVSYNDTIIKARTFITLSEDTVYPFNILNDHAAWIDSAIIYEITPYNFVIHGDFANITKKIPDLIKLGVNTLWIQPVYKTYYGGQGYDVTNYFKVRDDIGSEEDLKELIRTAKQNGFRVLFDFVPNHTSIKHPYALDRKEYGEKSHYWKFYQKDFDNVPYSMHYNHLDDFVYYFWRDLPNLNFDNPEVQKWITEAIKYWIIKCDIDGYRFDAVWGVNARNPEYLKKLRLQLKRIKPELFMLGEDKASWPDVFDEKFDAAFDWLSEESWVSHWSFQTNYSETGNQTIFNYPNENMRSELLRNALNNNGEGFHPRAKILRFLGNNDIFHFITHHGTERTKMAAILIFSLHGIPMLYNGQEIGIKGHPYSTEFIFFPGLHTYYDDPENLFPFYQRLIEIRKAFPALNSDNYVEIPVEPGKAVFAFRRWNENQNLFTVVNMKSTAVNASLDLPISSMNLDSTKTYYLTELLTGEVISGSVSELETVSFDMERFSSKIFLFADSTLLVTGMDEKQITTVSNLDFDLKQNFPNPFNPLTKI